MTDCHRPSDIPHEEHFVIITSTTMYEDNGRGDSTAVSVLKYTAYTDETQWKEAVIYLETLATPRPAFKAMRVMPATVTVQVNVR